MVECAPFLQSTAFITPNMPTSPLPCSELIRGLQSLELINTKASHKEFVATVGQFIDFGEAFGLAEFLAALPHMTASSGSAQCDSESLSNRESFSARYHETYDEIKAHIRHRVAAYELRLNKGGKDPMMAVGRHSKPVSEKERYQQFYALQQSEMESRVIALHRRVSAELSEYSQPLAQLVALDNKLGDIASSYSRRAFAVMPSLVGRRVDHFVVESSALEKDARATLLSEVLMLLLAELHIRIQPTQGLVQALIKEEI